MTEKRIREFKEQSCAIPKAKVVRGTAQQPCVEVIQDPNSSIPLSTLASSIYNLIQFTSNPLSYYNQHSN